MWRWENAWAEGEVEGSVVQNVSSEWMTLAICGGSMGLHVCASCSLQNVLRTTQHVVSNHLGPRLYHYRGSDTVYYHMLSL